MRPRRFAQYVGEFFAHGEPAGAATPREVIALRVAAAAAALAASIGTLVIAGWYSGSPRLLQLRPSFVAMQFNTAVAFVLAGGAVIAAARGRTMAAGSAALLAGLLGAANLVQIFGGLDLGIDQLFWRLGVDRGAMEPFALAKTSAPGRMAPNTALGFVFAASGVLLLARRRGGVSAFTVASALGVLVTGIGLVALLGYLGGPPTAFGWGGLTRMAAHTALALTAVGAAVSALAAARLEVRGVAFLARLPWLLGAAGAIVTAGLWQAYADQHYSQARLEVTKTSEHVRSEVSVHLDALVMRIVRMGKRWEFSRRSRHAWEYEAALNLTGLGGYEGIAWVDTAGSVRWVVPSGADSMARTLISPTNASGRAALSAAQARRTLTLSTAVRLPSRDWGILAVEPLFPGGRHDGYVVGILSVRHALEALISEGVVSDYGISAFDGAERIYPAEPPQAAELDGPAQDVWVTLHGLRWRLHVWPERTALAAFHSNAPAVAAVIGLLLTSLLVWVTTLIRTAQARELDRLATNERLKEAAAEHQRAVELAAVNERLVAEIAERERARDAAQTAEDRYRSLVDGLAVGVTLVTPEGIEAANPSAERILGLTADEMRGRTMLDPQWRAVREDGSPFPGEEHPAAVSLRTGEPRSNVVMGVHRPDGALVWMEVSSRALVRLGETTPYAAVTSFIDVTARKQLEGQLLQSQKMEAVGQLAGGVAHDFNNLLTVITGYSAILLETLDLAAPDRADLEEIKRAAERAAGLTRQLLAFSRKQIMQPRVLDLNVEVIAGLDKMLRRLIGEDVELVLALDPGLDLVKADPGQLEQVLMNLAVNARAAMPGGGRLTIETSNVDLGADQAARLSVKPGRYVMLAVSDTGAGMSREAVARMFEPFFTTKEAGRGTGLGLATVYGIVKQSGGDIWVYSEPGQGTTFKVYLPTVEQTAAAATTMLSTAPLQRGSETILLVEDDETLRVLSRRILQSRGYTVLEAVNGEDALAVCEGYEQRIDLVATDVVMPRMNGRVLVERLTAQRPAVRVLFMSGYTDDDILRRGIVDPRMAFLQKPFTPEALANKVREILDSPVPAVVPSLPSPGSPPAPVSR